MDMLEISHLSKSFGKNRVIRDLSFSVPEHTVFGFVGQNGAGKTTTMKMVLGLLPKDSGEISVNGEAVAYGQNRTNRYIGYLPDVPEFYGFLTPMEYLMLCGQVAGMPEKMIRNEAGRLLELVGLEQANKRIHGFSRGMKQRLGIAQALLGGPKLLICDEPTSALDPVGRKEILDILSSVKEHTTVLFSTHILSDVERICDEIAFLHDGKIAVRGRLEEVKQIHRKNGFLVEFFKADDAVKFSGLFLHKEGAEKRISRTELLFEGMEEKEMASAMRLLAEQEIPVRRIEMLEPTLESLFMEVVGK